MKIIFTDLPTTGGKIQVSFDGGYNFTDYEVQSIRESGIPLDDSQDYEKIKIKGPANVLKNLDVLSSINTLYESNLLPEDITGLVLKDFNGTFDKNLLQKYPNLTNVTIPNGVTFISERAFYSCSSLTSIDIPSSVTTIGNSAFSFCRNLTNITIPDGVTSIGRTTFTGCSSLTSINIPNNVTTIGSSTFNSCTSLTSIDIPYNVTSIGEMAFYYCTNLRTINYIGTEEQWNTISKGADWNKSCPSDMVINYNYQS